jgi:hypothetical protein
VRLKLAVTLTFGQAPAPIIWADEKAMNDEMIKIEEILKGNF